MSRGPPRRRSAMPSSAATCAARAAWKPSMMRLRSAAGLGGFTTIFSRKASVDEPKRPQRNGGDEEQQNDACEIRDQEGEYPPINLTDRNRPSDVRHHIDVDADA